MSAILLLLTLWAAAQAPRPPVPSALGTENRTVSTGLDGRYEIKELPAGQKGVPLADGTVLVFAEDPRRWTDGSRWVASARPDQSGRYQFRGLPSGAYLAIALDYVEDGNWNDPAYLESIRDRAERFVLEEAVTHALSLKMEMP